MADQVCYMLPGFLGSHLFRTAGDIFGDVTAWWRPWTFSQPGLQALSFTNDPGEDDATDIQSKGPLIAVYGTLVRWLHSRFARVVPVGYDFRKSVSKNALSMVAFINADLAEGEVGTLIGHSMGGLIASACLVAAGHSLQQRIRHLITIGTPFGGSMKAVEGLCGRGFMVNTANAVSLGIEGGRFFISDYYIRSVLANWSGAYDLLPAKSVFDAYVALGVPDHNAAAAWQAAEFGVNNARLAQSVIDRDLNRRVPTGTVHHAIVGVGRETIGPSVAEKIGQGSFAATVDGDGTVPLEFATAWISTNTTRIDVHCEHTEMAWRSEVLEAIDNVLNS